MKLKILSVIIGLVSSATVQAGEEASAKQVIAPIAPTCNWSWFAGGSVGYVSGDSLYGSEGASLLGLDDWDEPIYSLHLGLKRECSGDNCTHAFFLEVGYTEQDESVSFSLGDEGMIDADFETEIIPITLNYKYECVLSDQLNWYAGAGAGIALVDLKAVSDNGQTTESFSDDDEVFYAHIFAGLVYNVNEALELFAGARYIFMDDTNLGGTSSDAPLDGAAQYEIGARYNF
ncbi:MAG: outer membrane protein [Akkermansiaceae bacterium]